MSGGCASGAGGTEILFYESARSDPVGCVNGVTKRFVTRVDVGSESGGEGKRVDVTVRVGLGDAAYE